MTTTEPRWESHPASRVKFLVPASWTATHVDEKTVKVDSPTGAGIEFRYFTMGAPETLQDEAKVGEELKQLATDIEIRNKPTKFNQHGLAGFGFGGVGKRGDQSIAWFSVTIGDQHGHGVLAFGYGEVNGFKTAYPEIMSIMQSIQPIAPPAVTPPTATP